MLNKCVIIYSPQNSIGNLMEAMISGCDADIEILRVGSTAELLATAKILQPKLVILLDITPLIDGADVVARLHETVGRGSFGNRQHRTAIYVITWQQSEHTVLSLLESGVDQYLTFPICIERLRHKICEQMASNNIRQ